MKRTSIFSSEYEKRRKRKRRRIVISIILVVLLVVCGVLYGTGKLNKDNIKNMFTFKKAESSSDIKNNEAKKKEAEVKKKASEEIKKNEDEMKYIDITLSSGSKAKAVYVDKNGTKKFTVVEGLTDGSTFDINKSGNLLLVNDANSQDIMLYNVDGQQKNITKANYVTKSGQSFSKDVIMKQYPGYIWSLNAKFIDDTHVAYISQLPWFRKDNLDTYVWIMDLNNGSYQTVWNAKGKSVKIEDLNDKGITVDIDGNKKTVTVEGNVF